MKSALPHPPPGRPAPSPRRWLPLLALALAVPVGYYLWPSAAPSSRRADALRLANAGKLAEAEPLLLAAYEADHADAEVVAALAVAKLGGTDAAAAEAYLSRWVELRPAESRPWQLRMDLRHRTARGMVLQADRQRTMENALADGKRVLELEPGNDAVRREVAWLALQVGRPADAEPVLRKSLAAAPADPWLLLLLARSCHGQGRRLEAEEALDAALRVAPTAPDALLLRAVLHLEAEQPERAIPLLRTALNQRDSQRRECLYRLGLALAAVGQAEESKTVLAEVELLNLTTAVTVDQFPNNPAMRVQIAEAMLSVGRLAEAAAELDAVLAADPAFAPAHRAKAAYHDRMGQPDRAAEHRRRAGQDSP